MGARMVTAAGAGWRQVCCWFVLSTLFLAPLCSATDEERQEETSADEEATATATEVPYQADHAVEPLDAWVIATPTPTPTPVPTATPEDTGHGGHGDTAASAAPTIAPQRTIAEIYGPRAYRQGLSKVQQRRLRQLVPIQRAVAREIRVKADPRGEAELRVCTVHLNNFGPATEFKRLMKGETPEKRVARESSAVKAIAAAGCDVVALQAIYGVSFSRAQGAVEGLVKKLSRLTDAEWTIQMEEGTKQLLWGAFLIKEGAGEVLRSESVDGLRPAPFGPTPVRDVTRAPTTLSIKVRGKGSAQSKIVTLVNYDLRHALAGKTPDTAFVRVQLAEVLRGVVEKFALQDQVVNPQLLVLLGDRNDVRDSAPMQVLEGRLRLSDFTEDGTCKLEGEKELKLRCSEVKRKGKLLFGLISENAFGMRKRPPAPKPPPAKHEEEKAEGEQTDAEEKKVLKRPPPVVETRTSEIYLTQRDLKYARLLSDSLSRYRVGTEPVRNGLADSPLAWVELNWP